MAKKSKIVKNNKREETANFYLSKRKDLDISLVKELPHKEWKKNILEKLSDILN